MSKKNKHQRMEASHPSSQNPSNSHTAEYRIIKFDLVKVVILNVVYLAIILGLYYSNRQTGFLDNWFAKVLHF
jgi:hypothetical protein